MSQPDQNINWKNLCQMWECSKPQYLSQQWGIKIQNPNISLYWDPNFERSFYWQKTTIHHLPDPEMTLRVMLKIILMACLTPFVHFLAWWLVVIFKFWDLNHHKFLSLDPRIQKWNQWRNPCCNCLPNFGDARWVPMLYSPVRCIATTGLLKRQITKSSK